VHTVLGRRNRYISRNVNELDEQATSFGDHLSDSLTRFGGSWTFIGAFAGVLVIWIGLNGLQLLVQPFDPYPYVFLNLILSGLAAIQAPIILMSQNRQAARDRLAAEQDYACNLKAEMEVEKLHDKLDQLRETQWLDLIRLQQEQIALLQRLLDQQDSDAPASASDDETHDPRRVGRRRIVKVVGPPGTDPPQDPMQGTT
jgi:uncharacterized membrane protein